MLAGLKLNNLNTLNLLLHTLPNVFHYEIKSGPTKWSKILALLPPMHSLTAGILHMEVSGAIMEKSSFQDLTVDADEENDTAQISKGTSIRRLHLNCNYRLDLKPLTALSNLTYLKLKHSYCAFSSVHFCHNMRQFKELKLKVESLTIHFRVKVGSVRPMRPYYLY